MNIRNVIRVVILCIIFCILYFITSFIPGLNHEWSIIVILLVVIVGYHLFDYIRLKKSEKNTDKDEE